MDLDGNRIRSHIVAAALAVSAPAMAAASPAIADPVPAPDTGASAPASTEVPTSPSTPQRPTMSIKFPWRTASVAGPGALVYVKCAGSVGRACIGTLALKADGGSRKVAYSIESGEKQIVVVPLGSERELFDDLESARVVAHTMQDTGGSVRTTRVLRIN